jgi:hypothetical protein
MTIRQCNTVVDSSGISHNGIFGTDYNSAGANPGSTYRDHDAYMPKLPGLDDIHNVFFSYNNTPLFFSNSSYCQMLAQDQIQEIRKTYFKENKEDTNPQGLYGLMNLERPSDTNEQWPWFLWTFGTNGDINLPGYGIRDLSSYPPLNLKLNITFGTDFVPETTVNGTPMLYQIDVLAFTENFITLTGGEFFTLKMPNS